MKQTFIILLFITQKVIAQEPVQVKAKIDSLIQMYVDTKQFSGNVLVAKRLWINPNALTTLLLLRSG